MAYVKNIWVDQDVERPKTYEVTNNQDGSITLTDSFGLVTELGTPVNETNMNHIEDGIDGCAIRKHNLTETFNLGEWVLGGTGDDEGIYKSLVASNVGNAITDDTKWEKVEMGGGGGASRNIGEIVASTIPLIDANLHLLDGALLTYGSYKAFIDYIADLYDSGDYSAIFDTEANWQNAVTQYGVCGKFVYDSVNNTVRLPKITGFIEGTTDLTALGDLVQAGLPNITGTLGNATNGVYGALTASDAFSVTASSKSDRNHSGAQSTWKVNFNASNSNSIYGNSNTVQPQSIKVLYYIVVATSAKTNIQVDIDEIATDLNGKMDTDGTNAVSSVKFADGQWVKSELHLAYQVTSPKTANINYDLSSYLPNDNYSYEVLFVSTSETGTTSNSQSLVSLSSQYFDNAYISRAHTKTASLVRGSGCAVLPIGSNHIITVNAWSDNTGTFSLYALAYRRVGTNQ